MLKISPVIRDFIKQKSLMHSWFHEPSNGLYSWVNEERTFTFGYLEPAGVSSSFIFHHFHKIDLRFVIEFNDEVDRYWLDVHSRNERGEILMSNVKEVYRVLNPPSLLDICKKHFENLDNFNTLDELEKMMKFCPEM